MSREFVPLSQDQDWVRQARRRRRVTRDVTLYAQNEPCDGCGETSYLRGGLGCRCATSARVLADRCLANAQTMRDLADGDN